MFGIRPKPLSESEQEWWSRLRSLGRGRFIWWRGVIGWGVPFAAMTTVLIVLHDWWRTGVLGSPESIHGIMAILLFSPIGGAVFGLWIWQHMEARYPDPLAPRCEACGYCLEGIPEARRCPECGGGLADGSSNPAGQRDDRLA